ncbi:hypothetical protein U8U95_02080 [Enterococcus faecium]|uniref:hypothetical protein n=1 Tax=Enterococcus faecium TaxID=1352 RepID=UPI0027F9F599|nr:hypothetical protein [Enterococcus faecium]EME8213086.1 hypothetical protein [Enterococcus faecium]
MNNAKLVFAVRHLFNKLSNEASSSSCVNIRLIDGTVINAIELSKNDGSFDSLVIVDDKNKENYIDPQYIISVNLGLRNNWKY